MNKKAEHKYMSAYWLLALHGGNGIRIKGDYQYLLLLRTPKEFIQSHLLRPGSGSKSGKEGPYPT
jgi:hypothetical protein